MTRFSKTANGKYVVNGNKYEMLTGSRAQVWHGTACKTSGGLMKKDLMQNKAGRIVSREKHATAKKEMRLVKAGYGSKKGKFGFVKLGLGKSKGKSRKMKGGATSAANHLGTNPGSTPTSTISSNTASTKMMPPSSTNSMMKKGGKSRRNKRGGMVNLPLSPSYYDGKGVGTSGVALQFIAGQGN
jgi:hypothetical protein